MLGSTIQTLELFHDLTPEQREELQPILKYCRYYAGDVILRQNQSADHVYLVISGEVEISHRAYDGPVISVDRISSGEVFGWSAILGRDVYTASVVARTDIEAFQIKGTELQDFCRTYHDTGVVLLTKMASTVTRHPYQPVEQIMGLINREMNCPGKPQE